MNTQKEAAHPNSQPNGNAAQRDERLNTPERIVTRVTGAKFYCADCRETYQKCKCKVYRSVDTIHPSTHRTHQDAPSRAAAPHICHLNGLPSLARHPKRSIKQ
jgi:hypothetical protein